MHPALFLIPLLILSACGPSEKPADIATAAEARAAEAAVTSDQSALSFVDSSELAGSCRLEIGDADAQDLAARCIKLSPATHPLCHVDNSCKMIRDEIKRSCAQLPINRQLPAECG
ncbi:hypothetical protein [Asticcacaulis sp. AC402]|uniref:hypothetical protein n=1 Tax=Asticcacaulis sp. AC402 TaxID=1282361 RepID=UPI0003C3DB7F|nr:hypothetical protein [Asticcacaulis sp. AC402]ESQ76468.1 hypothetical protein ABAC402_05040 [Asticcacaulis sp. AC402]